MHDQPSTRSDLTRRMFLGSCGSTAAGSLLATELSPEEARAGWEAQQERSKPIGIQVGAVSFVDEGVEQVLDIFQERGAVNTIYLTTFTYGRGLAGRQVPGQPFPDHGVQSSDEAFFHGGNYAAAAPASTIATRFSRRLARRIMAIWTSWTRFCLRPRSEESRSSARSRTSGGRRFRASARCAEVDIHGRRAGTLCLMHPEVRQFWTALVTDLCSSYDIDGILFFNERNGPLLNATGSSHFQQIASGSTTCFCEHHGKAAREHGIDIERAREGYRQLDTFMKSALAGRRPSDGYFVEFWRLLVEYPEIIAWDKLFDLGKHRVLAEVHAAVKAIKPKLEVGFHVEHVNSFNPIFRATRRYSDLAGMADFLKVVVYNNCGGERYRRFIDNVGSTVFRDVPKDELLRFNNHLLGYGTEASMEDASSCGALTRLCCARNEEGSGRSGGQMSNPSRHRHRDPDRKRTAARPAPRTPTRPWRPR